MTYVAPLLRSRFRLPARRRAPGPHGLIRVPQARPCGTLRWTRSSAASSVPQGCSEIEGGKMGEIWGYARVSTEDQELGLQITALKEYGVPEANIVQEKASGKAGSNRPLYAALL